MATTADGVEMKPGAMLWVFWPERNRGEQITVRPLVEVSGGIPVLVGLGGMPCEWIYSTRLAALRAARDRAAAEVARLEGEIAKEAGQPVAPPTPDGGGL